MKRKRRDLRKRQPTRRKKKARQHIASAPPNALHDALQLYQQGQTNEAHAACCRAVDADPDCAEAWHLLGLLSYRLGDVDASIQHLANAIRITPDYAAAQNDLGNVLSDMSRFDEAEAVYRHALAGDPSHLKAHNNLGVVLKNLGRIDEAIASYEEAISLDPNYVDAYHNLGLALKKAGRWDEAVKALQRVLDLEPDRMEAYPDLCACLRDAGRIAETKAAFQEWLNREPDNPIAQHMSAAFSAAETPSRATDEYIRQVFDRFATTFDQELEQLGYQGPKLIAAALAEQYAAPHGDLDVLDAGCGTGLCGPVLRPYAKTLVGVDLSPAMLERARHVGVFDELIPAELTSFIEQHVNAYDLIVASDTLQYFGDLERLLAAAAGALRPHGVLIFTVERAADDAVTPFQLNPNGRYTHTQSYVERALEKALFELQSVTVRTLRTEADNPVAALLVRAVARGLSSA